MGARSLFVVIIALTVAFAAHAPAATAAADPNPAVGDWVVATYGMSFVSITELSLDVDIHIHKFTSSGDTFSADQIRQQYQGASVFGGRASGDAFIAELENDVKDSFSTALATAFPRADSRTVTESRLVRSSLDATGDSDPYEPTIDFELKATIQRNRGALGLADLSDEAVDSAFDAGARFSTTLTLVADAGYDATYVIRAPDALRWLESSEGAISADGTTLTVGIANAGKAAKATATPAVTLHNPTAPRHDAEDVRTTVEIEIPSFELAGGSLPLNANVRTQLSVVAIEDRFPAAIPAAVDLPYADADGIRALHDAGAVDDAQLASGEAKLLDVVKEALAGPLGGAPVVTGGFDDASLAASAGEPVVFAASAEGAYALDGVDADGDLAVVFRAGAAVAVTFDVTSEPGQETTFVIRVPDSVVLDDPTEGGTVSADGHSASWAIDNRGGTEKLALSPSVHIRDRDAPGYDGQTATLNILVDLKDVDITVAKAAGGDFGNILIDVTVQGDLGVIEVPDELKSQLPAGLVLDYLSSDAIRLLYKEGLISDAQLANLESRLLEEMRTQVGAALGTNAPVTGGLDAASLAAELVSTPLSGDKPIVFRAAISASRPLMGGDAAPQGQAAVSLYTAPPMSFDLPRVQGLDTVYKVILPKGLSVTSAEADRGSVQTGKEDGREYFVVTPTEDDAPAHATVAMSVTPTFVVIKFWPVLLAAFLLLALIVGGPIVGVVVAKRRRRARGGE